MWGGMSLKQGRSHEYWDCRARLGCRAWYAASNHLSQSSLLFAEVLFENARNPRQGMKLLGILGVFPVASSRVLGAVLL